MTLDEARQIIRRPADHDDATIRAVAALASREGDTKDAALAAPFLRFGLPLRPKESQS
ncbi:hypothetical protein [Sagittula sp. MA-2]|jgi:hypothetical protein|uniref:hypothetical protein n=1 Tax=Sagittula sp. MA-2 TaxID=3048007 RepID=UPI0024C2F0D1|nr:hypothetical protein [Sagittula sp. MA-2]WHZ33440.1 hypothetical protein QNI11_12335 [Sagittula sp. MA-2]